MRRPLKPFVTEYKGPRRASPSLAEPPPFENERPAPKFAETRKLPETKKLPDIKNLAEARPDSDDSYEAAMRAADALFAAPPERKVEARGAPPEHLAQSHDTSAEHAPTEHNGGRILRAIDEAPPPQYAALEAEFAPKRRGRKPGSKNKPKIPALTPASETQAFEKPDFETHDFETHALASDAPEPDRPAYTPLPQPFAVPAQRQVAALSTATPEPRGDKRYPWVRDRLKPGEDWKRRRLPRVCW